MSLRLDDYRALIALDEPFVAPPAAGDRRRTVDELLRELRAAGFELPHAGTDARRALRALLTALPPRALPASLYGHIDALLQTEVRDRTLVDVRALAPFTAGPAGTALFRGDITTVRADAIVNAANSGLLGCFRPFHACIDNAIHDAAGPRLRDDCAAIMDRLGAPEATGTAKITRAYNLPSRYVVHTVGPIVDGLLSREHEVALADAYRACLDLCAEVGTIRSLVFCGISTGVFGFPKRPAARIALATVQDWLCANPGVLDLVVFDVWSAEDEDAYRHAAEEIRS
jgi:O-acetyl-ADP-ribose deacetylase (regulator of RNase III)